MNSTVVNWMKFTFEKELRTIGDIQAKLVEYDKEYRAAIDTKDHQKAQLYILARAALEVDRDFLAQKIGKGLVNLLDYAGEFKPEDELARVDEG